jgi:hypothetical protein
MGHAAHDHQMVAYLTVRTVDLGHAQVHVGRELPVGLDLAGAGRRAGLQGAEVQEAEIDRLLQLPG